MDSALLGYIASNVLQFLLRILPLGTFVMIMLVVSQETGPLQRCQCLNLWALCCITSMFEIVHFFRARQDLQSKSYSIHLKLFNRVNRELMFTSELVSITVFQSQEHDSLFPLRYLNFTRSHQRDYKMNSSLTCLYNEHVSHKILVRGIQSSSSSVFVMR